MLLLSTYSPDLNPIKQAFTKLKAALRRAAARSVVAVMDATTAAYGQITAVEAAGY